MAKYTNDFKHKIEREREREREGESVRETEKETETQRERDAVYFVFSRGVFISILDAWKGSETLLPCNQ